MSNVAIEELELFHGCPPCEIEKILGKMEHLGQTECDAARDYPVPM